MGLSVTFINEPVFSKLSIVGMFSLDSQKSKLEDHIREIIWRKRWLRPTSPPTFLPDSMGSGLILHVPYILYRRVKS